MVVVITVLVFISAISWVAIGQMCWHVSAIGRLCRLGAFHPILLASTRDMSTVFKEELPRLGMAGRVASSVGGALLLVIVLGSSSCVFWARDTRKPWGSTSPLYKTAGLLSLSRPRAATIRQIAKHAPRPENFFRPSSFTLGLHSSVPYEGVPVCDRSRRKSGGHPQLLRRA